MSNIKLVDIASTAVDVEGTAENMDGGAAVVSITATSYGTDGKVVLKASADGVIFTTLEDAATTSGLAEYSEDIIFNLDRIAQGWQFRVDFEITTGTATDVKVFLGTN